MPGPGPRDPSCQLGSQPAAVIPLPYRRSARRHRPRRHTASHPGARSRRCLSGSGLCGFSSRELCVHPVSAPASFAPCSSLRRLAHPRPRCVKPTDSFAYPAITPPRSSANTGITLASSRFFADVSKSDTFQGERPHSVQSAGCRRATESAFGGEVIRERKPGQCYRMIGRTRLPKRRQRETYPVGLAGFCFMVSKAPPDRPAVERQDACSSYQWLPTMSVPAMICMAI